MRYKIRYGDGTTYTDLDGEPQNAPKRNVQVISQTCDLVAHRIERDNDYYVWDESYNGWKGCDQFGLYDYLIDPGFKIVLFGRQLTNEEYSAILTEATRDPDFPKKDSWAKSERRV